jgi:hypothetical protein
VGTTPTILVPPKLATLLDATISLRQSYSDDVSDVLDDSNEKRDSNDKHAFFLQVLKKVREILKPRLPKDSVLPSVPKTTTDIVNMFENLDLEEPSEAFEQAPDITPSSSPEPIYKAERQNDISECFFALCLLLHDFSRLRTEVSLAWGRYKIGAQDLVAAALTTNTAVDLARSMTDDLKSMFEKHGGAVRMVQIYYAAQCLAAGISEEHRARPGDDMNFAAFNIAEANYVPAMLLLDAFCNVLKVNSTPEMRKGIYGFYQPHAKRSSMSNRDKFKEDKILLLEMLPEFFYYCRITEPATSRPPVEDELSRGLRTMFKTKEVTLPLAFAAALFLDIHHLLRKEVASGFERLANACNFVEVDIEEEVKFHEGIKMETWPEENDKAVQQFVETLKFWCHEDQQLIHAKKLGRVNIPERHHIYRQHPWLCGIWKYYVQMRFHEISIVFVNAWGSVMSCAHLYNAVGGGKTRETMWKDLDVVIPLQGEKTFFIGDAPTKPDDCLNRFALAMGASAANLAKSTRKRKGLIHSKRGPKGLKELGPVLQTFKGRFCDGNGQTELRADDVQKVLECATWTYDLNEDDRVDEVYKDTDVAPTKKTTAHLSVAKLLGIMRDMVHAEMIEVSYDYLRLHRQCWRLLSAVKTQCRDDLIKIYGPDYMVTESQLPFIVGYVLMSSTKAQELGEVLKARLPGQSITSKVLKEATEVVKVMLDTGAGALIVDHILPKGLGLQIDFEFEEEEEE